MAHLRVSRVVLTVVIGLALAITMQSPLLAGTASAPDFEEIITLDDCDPADFAEPGTGLQLCDLNFEGDTPIGEFFEELLDDQVADAWEFDPDEMDIDGDEDLKVISEGGEFHTLTLVGGFGPGVIPGLNVLSGLPAGPPRPECAGPIGPGLAFPAITPALGSSPPVINIFIPAGASGELPIPSGTIPSGTLPAGTWLFMCCLHPWMRLTITVEDCPSCS